MGKTASASPVVEIGEEALAALIASNDASSEQIQAVAMAVLAVVTGVEEEETALAGIEMEQHFLTNTYNALVCMFLEAAKSDLSDAELTSFLRSECGFSESRGAMFLQLFADRKEGLRSFVSHTANRSSVPQLLGADWRLDYCVSSSEDRGVRELVYHVSLNTQDPVERGVKKVNFACSVEELQDLVARLKDACKSVERALQSQ